VQDQSECLVDEFHGCPALTRVAGKRLDARMFLRRTRHHGTTRHGIAAIGCVDRHMQQIAEKIDHAIAFMPFDFVAAVDPAFFACVLGLDALRVDHPVTRRCRATVVLAMERIHLIPCSFPNSAFVSSAEVIVNRLPGRKIVGEHAPLASGLHDVQMASTIRLRGCRLALGCRNVLSFDAKPIPGLGLHHRTHWGSLIGVGVAIGIGIESAHRSKQPARYQSLIPISTPTPTPTKHPKTGKRLF
jgi:hypothetical protein